MNNVVEGVRDEDRNVSVDDQMDEREDRTNDGLGDEQTEPTQARTFALGRKWWK